VSLSEDALVHLEDIACLGRLLLEMVVFPSEDVLHGLLPCDETCKLLLELCGEAALLDVLHSDGVHMACELLLDSIEGELERLGAGVGRLGTEPIGLPSDDLTVSLSLSMEVTNKL